MMKAFECPVYHTRIATIGNAAGHHCPVRERMAPPGPGKKRLPIWVSFDLVDDGLDTQPKVKRSA